MVIAAGVLLGLVLIRWGALLVGATLVIPRVRSCPACFADTVAVRKVWLRRLAPWLGWRWCPGCGWEGPTSRRESELVPGPARRRAERRASSPADPFSPGEEPPDLPSGEWKAER